MNRVWAYIIGKELGDEELNRFLKSGKDFVSGWTAHENKLSAGFEIFKKRIILIKVNESATNASGCSIDKLTRFIRETELLFNVELLNRFLVAYKNGDDIKVTHSGKVRELLDEGVLSEETIVLNTAVANEKELQNWEQPLKNTWLNKYLIKT